MVEDQFNDRITSSDHSWIPLPLAFQLFGLASADLVVIVGYFVVILGIGFWAMRRIRTQSDYFLAGRRFGKVIQIFASFGQATSSDTAVSSTTMVSTNGSAGVWAGLAGGLFYMPLVWFWSMWFRRVRLTTLADIYEERYGSKMMAGFYALTQAIFLVMIGALGLVALSKTVAAIATKPENALTSAEHQEYERSQELHQLEAADYALLSPAQQARLDTLRRENPTSQEFSAMVDPETVFSIVMALIVVTYARARWIGRGISDGSRAGHFSADPFGAAFAVCGRRGSISRSLGLPA